LGINPETDPGTTDDEGARDVNLEHEVPCVSLQVEMNCGHGEVVCKNANRKRF